MKLFYECIDENVDASTFTKTFCFEKDDYEKLGVSPDKVLKLFESVATEHAKKMGVGFEEMLSKNLLWVTMRIKYEVVNQPSPETNYKIATYPSSKNMMEYDRDYLITDENGKVFIKGQSKWCLIDAKTRHLVRMIQSITLSKQKPLFEERFLKTDIFEPQFLPDHRYKITEDDIDNNRHTNNTVYAKLVAYLLRNESREIKFFQINFLKECVLDDSLELFLKQDAGNEFSALGRFFNKENSFSAKIKF